MEKRITGDKVPIDENSVHAFFDNRQNKKLPHRYNYVNYQDSHPELVFERDKIEKERIGRYFPVGPGDFVLDIGCGVGRWGDLIIPILKEDTSGLTIPSTLLISQKNSLRIVFNRFFCKACSRMSNRF